jgi:lysophospholipase L1-like esterase
LKVIMASDQPQDERSKTMAQRLRRRLIAFLVIVILSFLGLEAILSLDLLGMYYWRDQYYVVPYYVTSPSGYALMPGKYQLTHSSFTILPDESRRVPATNPNATQTLILLGDSLTFGWGVNDEDTWANRIAEAFPEWHVINTGVNGFSSENVRLTLQSHPDADAYLYFLSYNDAAPSAHIVQTRDSAPTPSPTGRTSPAGYESWIALYLDWLTTPRAQAPNDMPRFEQDVRVIGSDPRVLIVAFEGAELTDQTDELAPGVKTIPEHNSPNSYVDGHPNAQGHARIAESLVPILQEFLSSLNR